MANLYKKPIVRINPLTGTATKSKSQKWWGQYRDANGRLRRHPLAVDKMAAQSMLNELVRKVERERAGLVDPTDKERRRPLAEHLKDFTAYLANKGVTDKQVGVSRSQINGIVGACKWKYIADISASGTLSFLGDLRRKGRSAQTYNHYLKAVKQFTRWLVRDRRTPTDPLVHLSRLNVSIDRRHDRRALSSDEFGRLIDAARAGGQVEGMAGPDRAMMYTLAAWTGFRKGEIGSLTRRSLDLDASPPTATVAACFSKRQRQDTQVLHPELAAQLADWLDTRETTLAPDEPLFPISGRAPGGVERKTHKMMQVDLAAARQVWIKEAATDRARRERESSDFLAYRNHDGRYADFHSCRHLFITNLERAGVSPKMAQTLARHSDIRLTLQVYTHVGLSDQAAAIQLLEGPALVAQPRLGGATAEVPQACRSIQF